MNATSPAAKQLPIEIDAIIANLQDYSDAIRGNDPEQLCRLLREGRLRKEEIDDERF